MAATRIWRCSLTDLMYCISTVLIIFVTQSDCFRWVKGAYESTVYANRSMETIFKWKYDIGSADSSTLSIRCGYIDTNKEGIQNLVYLVRKDGHNSDMRGVGSLPGTYHNQIQPFQQLLPGSQVDRSVIGFKIVLSELVHPINYRCNGMFNSGGFQDLFSGVKKLVVLDPPKIQDCLQGLKPVAEHRNLQISCSATGNPQPTLQCTLLTAQNDELAKIPAIAANQAIIEQVFQKVDRDAEYIRCIADGGRHTGTANVTVAIIVNHTPRAPDTVDFLPAFNHSTINVRWTEILNNETGGALIGYKITVYDATTGPVSGVGVTLLIGDIQPSYTDAWGVNYYNYEVVGLDPLIRYTVIVRGYNQFGDGEYIKGIEITPSEIIVRKSTGDDDSSVGVIIGGIIAGIVFIVIFVVLAVWCSTRSKKHEKFPTSHVEDAVDYPPGVGQSLYASVDKNRNKPPSLAGSANEYPDVVNNTNELRPMVSSPSYEASNKSFV